MNRTFKEMIPGLIPTVSQFHPSLTLTNLVGREFDDEKEEISNATEVSVKYDVNLMKEIFGKNSGKKIKRKSSEVGRKLIKKTGKAKKFLEDDGLDEMSIGQTDGHDSPATMTDESMESIEEQPPVKRPRSTSATEEDPQLQCGLCQQETGDGDKEVAQLTPLTPDQQEILKLRRKIAGEIDLDSPALCQKHFKIFNVYENNHKKFCSNPFSKHPAGGKKVQARGSPITLLDAKILMSSNHESKVVPGDSLCKSCKSTMDKMIFESKAEEKKASEDDAKAKEIKIQKIQESVGIPKTSRRDLRTEKQKLDAIREISDGLKRENNLPTNDEDLDVMLQNMKIAISKTDSYDEKYKILSLAPSDWSLKKIQETFAVSQKLARKSKTYQKDLGIFEAPGRKSPMSQITEEVKEKIKQFYEDDENSRQLPGMNDVKTIKVNGVKQKVQKRLLLSTIGEAFLKFKEENKDLKVGKTFFFHQRPKNVVLAGTSGTHSVCVCTYCGNMKLLLLTTVLGTRATWEELISLPGGQDVQIEDIIDHCVCEEGTQDCYYSSCVGCAEKTEALEGHIRNVIDAIYGEDEITFSRWECTDRAEKVSIQMEVDDFLNYFIQKLSYLKKHFFLVKKQRSYLKTKKATLKVGEIVACGDFAENYSNVVQEGIQGVHWNHTQTTLHPFVVYYKTEEDGDLKHKSYVFVSDRLKHDVQSVYAFQKKLIESLRETIELSHVIYFTDGAASQYKNRKNFANLCQHFQDFGVTAEWNFHPSCHGKGPWDGIGGLIKREARLESLRRRQDSPSIENAQDLYEFAKRKFQDSIEIILVQNLEIHELETMLNPRFAAARTIPGTQGFHQFIPENENNILAKLSSLSSTSTKYEVLRPSHDLEEEAEEEVPDVFNFMNLWGESN